MTNENRGKDVHSRRDRRRAHLGSWSLCRLLSSAPLLLRSSAVCSPQLLRPSAAFAPLRISIAAHSSFLLACRSTPSAEENEAEISGGSLRRESLKPEAN